MAETEFRQALAAEPRDAHAHSLLARCLVEREQFKEATEEAQQAVHLAPDLADAHYALAVVWHKRNYDAEALAAIYEALRLDSSQPHYFALLSQIHLNEARWQPALEAAEQGLQLDAEDVACTNLRAIALVKLGQKTQAGETIDAALRRNPDNSVTHANRGWTLLEQNDPKAALEHFREALRLDPTNEWARRGIVEALKARNFIYALMLRYFLFMAKFSRRGRWGIVLGAYFGNQVLRAASQTNPALAHWILPLRILYLAFAVMTWIASPLFNLTLRLNSFGRLALSREQIVASNWMGGAILLVLLSLAGCVIFGVNTPWIIATLLFGGLLLPVAGMFKCPKGPLRTFMYFYTGVAALVAIAAISVFFAAPGSPNSKELLKTGVTLMTVSLVLSVASGWIVNIANTRRQRR